MKKILLSLVVILGVSAVVAGATRAYFTDTETITGNTFAAGTFDLADNSETWMKGVTFSNIYPGMAPVRKWVVLNNAGTLDIGSLKVSAENLSDAALLSQLKVSVVGQVGSSVNAYYTPDWTGGAFVSPDLTNINLLGSYFYSPGTPATVIHPGESDTVILDFSLPSTVGNEWNGKTATFDLKFAAEQTH